jgi:hypothetical protein
MTTTARDIAGPDGGRVSLTPRRLDEVEARVGGFLLRAGDDGWNDAVLVWNGIVARFPAFGLQPTSAQNIRPRA